MMGKRIIVVGSGLSGMTAAMDLCDAGHQVHILESRAVIGGRTSSWNDNGMLVESGLHRFLGFYSELPSLLKRAGVEINKLLHWEDEVEVRMPDGEHAVFGLSLHKPLKTFGSMLDNEFLSAKDKLSLGGMFAAGVKDYELHPSKLDGISVLEYAKKHGVSDKVINRALRPMTEGVFFMKIDKYSAYNLFGLLVPFLPRIIKARVGAFTGGMSEVMMQPLADYILSKGGQLTLGARVDKIETHKGRVTGVAAGNDFYKADAVVLAASLHGAKAIAANSSLTGKSFDKLHKLPTMPAVTFQIELSEPSMKIDRTTFGPGTSMTSFAEQSRTTFRASPGRLSVILTPPEEFIDKSPEEVLEVVVNDARKLGIELEDNIKQYRKINLPHDFYSLEMGSEKLRPTQKTSIQGLVLAGDYTKQNHLATMEGAVVAGHKAAALLIGDPA
jgi:15-cis-phytoene desaturase